MRIQHTIKLLTLSLILVVIAGACGDGVDETSERVSGYFVDTRSDDRLAQRVDDTLDRLSGAASHLSVYATDTVTLQQLQAAGIPVGSNHIACDDPLEIVIVEGMFDRENLFSTGVAMAGGSFEALAMDLVAEIYDPETDMPLGMIGDETGGRLTSVTQDDKVPASGVDGSLLFMSQSDDNGDQPTLIPQATCQ